MREGRRNEFSRFQEFADPASRRTNSRPERIADLPASKPQADPSLGPAREALYRRLIALRATEIVPRLDGAHALTAEAIGPKAVVARWRLGDGAVLTVATNLDAQAVTLDPPAGVLLFASTEMPARLAAGPLHLRVSRCVTFAPMSDDVIRDLAHRAGIAVEWQDFAGRPKTVTPDVLRHLLEALGLPCKTRGDLLASRRLLQRRSNVQALPPLITAMAGRPTRLDVGASDTHMARLSLEAGGGRDIAISPVRGRLRVPAINDTGYHRLLIEDREFVLAVAPTRCRTIDDAVPDARLWGIAAQVYSLRHCGDGGIGDAAGIAALAEAAGSRGADALALSPLHALFGADPSRFGPYSPSTRLFLNPLHASPAQVFGEAHVADTLRAEGLSETFERLEALSLIDWPAAARAKHRLLRALFEPFIDAPDAHGKLHLDFARFRADGGELLSQHVVFETLHAGQAAAGAGDWHRWPTDLRDPDSAAVSGICGVSRARGAVPQFSAMAR